MKFMKLMKTALCALLALCMLTACAFAEETTDTAAEDTTVYEDLSDILNAVADDVQPGTAGSSLRATECAIRLLTWGCVCDIAPEGAVSEFSDFASTLTGDRRDAFIEAFADVAAACGDLCTDAAAGMMADAGYTEADILWGSEIPEAAQTVIDAAAALE